MSESPFFFSIHCDLRTCRFFDGIDALLDDGYKKNILLIIISMNTTLLHAGMILAQGCKYCPKNQFSVSLKALKLQRSNLLKRFLLISNRVKEGNYSTNLHFLIIYMYMYYVGLQVHVYMKQDHKFLFQ